MGKASRPELVEKRRRPWSASVLVVLWLVVVACSLNHICQLMPVVHLSPFFRGTLAWITTLAAILYIGRTFLPGVILVSLLFLTAGYMTGPFLEPPADPLDHLRNTYAVCRDDAAGAKTLNSGYWQYSMTGVIVCRNSNTSPAEDVLRRIDIANGLFWGAAAAILYIVGRQAGLSARWSFVSVCIAWLFMGTGIFSYFRYYSFAPSFSSIWIYWLWIGQFFFRRDMVSFVLGGLVLISSLPVVAVNHLQEAVFLGLIGGVWGSVYLFHFLKGSLLHLSEQARRIGWILVSGIVVTALLIAPQLTLVQDLLGELFIHDYWQENQEAVVTWQGFHLIGKLWSYRISDTLGIMGFVPVALSLAILYPPVYRSFSQQGRRAMLLGLLPFMVYCIPLLHYVWLANCVHLPTHIRYYYRICYASLFWLPIALFIQALESSLLGWFGSTKGWKKCLPIGSMSIALILFGLASAVRSSPIYGKQDFLLVESRPWWPEWREIIEYAMQGQGKQVATDFITGYVLHGIFDVPLENEVFNLLSTKDVPKLTSDDFQMYAQRNDVHCLINLRGFEPTWVPVVSGHWSSELAHTRILYDIDMIGIKNNDFCTVFK